MGDSICAMKHVEFVIWRIFVFVTCLDGRQILRIYDITQKNIRATCLVQTSMGCLWLVGSMKL